jgi:uncharacterized membrane protein (GlpM family)
MDLLIKFLVGGIVVSAFSTAGDLLKPKSFAGLLTGAPTIALATMSLTFHKYGASYLAMNARSMVAGALSFGIYASTCSFILMRSNTKALAATAMLIPVWGSVATALWIIWLRR